MHDLGGMVSELVTNYVDADNIEFVTGEGAWVTLALYDPNMAKEVEAQH